MTPVRTYGWVPLEVRVTHEPQPVARFATLSAMRDERRERDRYPRASLREQLGNELRALLGSTPLVMLLLVLVGGWLVLTLTRPEVLVVGELTAGDCLYIRAADADTDSPAGRAIGSDGAVITALFAAGAERAPCDGSHSHEVVDGWVLKDSLVAPYPGQAELTLRERARCEAAFERHVGRPVEGSDLALTIAVPPPGAWDEGARVAACLVSDRDGAFLLTPAKDSRR
jgi:hypothetical protein